jgi:hypothetical protein
MYQVTAIFQNTEIGYGEADSIGYATEECMESIPEIFNIGASPEEIDLLIVHPAGNKSRINLRDHEDLMETLRFNGYSL